MEPTGKLPDHDYLEVKTDQIPAEVKPEKVDHLKEVAELVSGLAETSPSGANTIGQKIMYHVNALAHPAEHDKAEAEKAKADKKLADEAAEKTRKAKAEMKKVA